MTSLFKVFLTLLIAAITPRIVSAQQSNAPSTSDLAFLMGHWDIERVYSPGTEKERMLTGTLTCRFFMDSTFINCRYEMERPGMVRGLDEVFFNYNSI